MYTRKVLNTLISRMEEKRRFIQVLAGPRQIGKTTLIDQYVEGLRKPYTLESADFVNTNDAEWISSVWDKARSEMNVRHQDEHILIIDEIQKISNWSEAVKMNWDADTRNKLNIKVILLGSSRLLLMHGLTESLAGRFELIRMGHWDYQEMHDAFGFSIEQYIYFGGYPGTAELINDETRWQTIVRDSLVESAISKDVLMTSNIYKPALLRQLFEIGCSYSAQILSLNKVLGQLVDAGNMTTLSNYLHILQECNLLGGLQKFAGDTARKYNSSPKFQVFNNALLTAYNGKGFDNERLDPKRWGRWVESAVGAHLINNADKLGYKLYYWRERDEEVDFILTKYDSIVALEIKSGMRGMNTGLPLFTSKFKPKTSLIIGTNGISLEEFFTLDINQMF